MRKMLSRTAAAVAALGFAYGCSKTPAPPEPQLPVTSGLYAVPPSVSVSAGGIQHVYVSGGVPPYSIQEQPGPIATAQLDSADSSIAVLKITGVGLDTASTAVKIKDNSSNTPKTVSIPILVF